MSDMSVGVSAGEGWRLAQTMGGVMAADKMARLGIVEPELEAYSHHENRKLASTAMHATSKAPYDAPETFLAELDKLRVPNVLVATGEFVSRATPRSRCTPAGRCADRCADRIRTSSRTRAAATTSSLGCS